MTAELSPELEVYAQDVRDLLGLQAWRITFVLVDSIDDDPTTAGQCQYKEAYQVARILLRRDEPDDAMREHIFHELLHCALAHFDQMAMRIAEMLPDPQRAAAISILYDANERTVVALTRALRKGINPPPQEPAL